MMIARGPIALPAIAHRVESLEPWIAPVFDARCAADQNSSARGEDAIERRSRGLRFEPVDRAADGDDVEGAELFGDVLETALDELHRDAGALGRLTRGLDHARLRIDADDLPAVGRKADRQNARTGADVEQALTSIKAELLRDRSEERRPIRRPGAFIISDSGGEASHGDPCGDMPRGT